MPGSRDNVYDLTSELNKSKTDYFFLLVDHPKITKKNINKEIPTKLESFTNLRRKADYKFLIIELSKFLQDAASIKPVLKSKKIRTSLQRIAEQNFNYLYLSFNRENPKKKILNIKEFNLGVNSEEELVILNYALINIMQDIAMAYDFN